MRKILSLVLTLLMVFSVMPIVMVSAAVETYYLDASQIGLSWTQKLSSASTAGGTAGDYATDGYTKYLTGCSGTGRMLTVRFPESIYDEEGLISISFALRANSGKYESKYYKVYMAKAGASYTYESTNFTDASDLETLSAWQTVSTTQKVFTLDLTSDSRSDLLTKRCNVFTFPVYTNSSGGTFYVDYISYTVEHNSVAYDVTVDGEVVESVYEGKKFTVPTPAEGYHYTDGINTYVGGEEITVTGNVDLVSEINTYDVTVDGVVADTVVHGGTFTVPTPATGYDYTDGTNTYVGGEVITVTAPVAITSTTKTTKVVYTMDEGKTLEGATTFYGAGSVMDVNGDNKLALKAKSDAFAYFQLPTNWSSKPYYKPTKITFTASSTDTSKVKAYKSLSFASALADDYSASGSSYTIAAEGNLKYFPTTVSINVTEDMYSYKYITGKLYSDNWSESNASYVYIDNVTIDYEYDFDYVAPTTYDVTIDGVKVATVEEGDTFVLPAAPEGKQYVDGYTAGQEFVVTSELAFTTEDIPFVAPVVAISMQKGAGLRFNEVTGMRYKATVDTAAVEGYIAEGYTVTMGTLISPADIIGSFDALTFEADENNYLDVVTTGYFDEETGTIAGTISNIREANWGRNYIARSYVKLEKDGEVYVSYATENDNTRSVKFLANAVIDNDALPANTAQVALIEKWAAAADWKA